MQLDLVPGGEERSVTHTATRRDGGAAALRCAATPELHTSYPYLVSLGFPVVREGGEEAIDGRLALHL